MELELMRVSKRYGKVSAIEDLSFRVPSGKILALLGPSGCGKTTTLRVIAGLAVPDSGGVFFDGTDVTSAKPASRNVGMVFQNLALFPNLTVRENIAFPLEARGRASSQVDSRTSEVMEMLELEGLQDRYPHQLSGGQQQRVAIARAISADVKLLLFDEPLASLDPGLKTEISEVIGRVQRQLDITTVYVTHDQTEAVLTSDLLGIMFGGRLEAIGETRRIYESPPTENSARFLGATNSIQCSVEATLENEILVRVSGRRLRVQRPRWWESSRNTARLLFRPEDAGITESSKGVLDGKLVGVMFGGERLVASVRTDQGDIECRGDPSSLFETMSRKVGSTVGVRVDLHDVIVF
jgi:putative spermidine/putrescine transport system ATP-binding protein